MKSEQLEYDEIARFIERHIDKIDRNRDGRINAEELAAAIEQHQFYGENALIVAYLYSCYSFLLKADQILERRDRKKLDAILSSGKGIDADTIQKISQLIEANEHKMRLAKLRIPPWLNRLVASTVVSENDENEDRALGRAEIEAALKKPGQQEHETAMLHYLLSEFDTIAGDRNSISTDDAWSHFSREDINAGLLAVASDAVLRLLERRVNYNSRALYATPDHPELSVKPQAIQQGLVQDCLFLAMLASQAQMNSAVIINAIKPLAGNPERFEVTFPQAADEPIVVSTPSDAELLVHCGATRFGLWPAIMERACGVYCMKTPLRRLRWLRPWNWAPLAGSKVPTANASYGGWHLFGKLRWEITMTFGSFADILKEQVRERRPAALATTGGKRRDQRIRIGHAYALIDYDSKQDIVRVYNPWGCIKRFEEVDDPDGGFIELTLQQAFDSFSMMHRVVATV